MEQKGNLLNDIEIIKIGFCFLGINVILDESSNIIYFYDKDGNLLYTKKMEYRESKFNVQYNTCFIDKDYNEVEYYYEESQCIHKFKKGNFEISIKINKETNKVEGMLVCNNKNFYEQFLRQKLEIKKDYIAIRLNKCLDPNHDLIDDEIKFICDLSQNSPLNLVYSKVNSTSKTLKIRCLEISDNKLYSPKNTTTKTTEQINEFLLTVLAHKEIKELFNYVLDRYSNVISNEITDYILNCFDISKLITDSNLKTDEVDNYINDLYLENVVIKKKNEKVKERKKDSKSIS